MLSSAYKLTALLLLHVGGLAAAKKNDLCERQHALTCAGGGYRAYSTCAGFLSSFLTTTEGSLDTLFEGIDSVAGVSGGSWWATGLMYSGEMPAMHETMADDPTKAGSTFFTEWLAKTGPIPQRRLTAEHIDPGFSFLCGYVINGRGPGDNFERYVRNPTSLLDDATLSSPPARDFAKGKLFLVLASVPTPGGEGWENEKVWVHFTYDGANQPNGSIYYSAKSSYDDDGFTLWAPAKWSVVLGDDPDAESLLPFCGREDCQGVYLHYTGYSTEHPSAVADSPPLGEIFHDAFGHPGHVLLDQVAGTSSAALASHVLDPEDVNQPGFPQVTNLPLDLVLGPNFAGITARPDVAGAVFSQDICNRQAYWTDRERSERPFSQMGDNEITQQLISETADSGLQALNDGAWTDNTGITAAVAALTSATGCNKLRRLSVTALLNGERVDLAASSLEVAGLPNLFDGSGKAHGPICSSPSYDEVIAQLDSPENILFQGPTDESGLKLESIRYGTIKCETMDNDWYGVKGGFLVDINWIWAESNYPTTPPGGWAAGHPVFQNLVQDIVTAMVESSDETIGPLLPEISRMFFPKTFEDPCTTMLWPTVEDESEVCDFCKVSIENFADYYENCDAYCYTLGRSCLGAWDEEGLLPLPRNRCEQDEAYSCGDPMSEALGSRRICECSAEPAFFLTPQLLFRASGLASAYSNMWPGWYMEGYEGMRTNGKSKLTYGKQSAYDELCLHAITFKDANGTYATYKLSEYYRGMTLLQIMQKCRPRGSMDELLPPDCVRNTGKEIWSDGHCKIGYLMEHHGRPFAEELRLFVGDGIGERDDWDDWAIFMPIMGNGKGDFQESDTWAFGSKGETCTGYQNMVSIEGYGAGECAYDGYNGHM